MSSEDSTVDPVGVLVEEFVARYRKGERPPLSEYLDRYPEHAERIRQIFPMLPMMEQAASGADPSLSATGDEAGADTNTVPQLLERGGGYRILREIGRGGMGVVYEAEQVALGRHVAVKVLPLHAAKGGAGLERFQREARAAARLHHTNIVPVYEVSQAGDLCFYAMQFIQGRSLDQVLDELRRLPAAGGGQPPLAEASVAKTLLYGFSAADHKSAGVPVPSSSVTLPGPAASSEAGPGGAAYFRSVARVGVQVAGAMDYAHREDIIHRDIKPSNLILDMDGRVWVTDFGLAKTDGVALTQTGDVVGTVRYMAPERFRGWADPRSDVYSLGLTLYEMLLLRPAFAAADRMKLIHHVTHDEPSRPRKVDPRIPGDLETIVLKAIDKEPARRYQTAAALAEDLQRFLDDRPIRARQTGALERAWRWCRRNPAVAALVVAIALVTMAGFAAVFSQMQVAQEKEGEAKRARETAEKQRDDLRALNEKLRRTIYAAHLNLAHRSWEDGTIGRMQELLDGERPLRGEEDLRGFEWYYLKRLCRSELLTIQAKGTGRMACSPDGKLVAVSRYRVAKTEIAVLDAVTGKGLLTIKGPAGPVWDMAFSPDAQRLASGHDKTVRVWDAKTGQEILNLPANNSQVLGVAFSPDGQRLASTLGTIWDVATGRETVTLDRQTDRRESIAFSPDGKRLATGDHNGLVKIWEMGTGKELLTLRGHTDMVLSVAFSPDGKHLASGSRDQTVKVWDLSTGNQVRSLEGHTNTVTGVAYSPDGRRLASASGDETVRVWDAVTGKELFSLKGHIDDVWSVSFSSDGKRLVSAGGGEVKVWDATTPPEFRTVKVHDLITCAAFSPDGKRLASGRVIDFHRDRRLPSELKVWDTTTGLEILALKGHSQEVNSVVFSADGKWLASAGIDEVHLLPPPVVMNKEGTVKIWDTTTGREVITMKEHANGMKHLAFSPDGQRLAGTSDSHLSFRSDGRGSSFTQAPGDRSLKVWNARTGKELLSLTGHTGVVNKVAFSPDGQRLASCSDDKTVRVWDADKGQELLSLKGHTKPVRSAAFSPDGKHLASASDDKTVKVWDATTGQEDLSLRHEDTVYGVSFSPDGKRLAGVAVQGVKVWDAMSGQELLTLKTKEYGTLSVAFSQDGRRLAIATRNGMVKVWDATPLPDELLKGGR